VVDSLMNFAHQDRAPWQWPLLPYSATALPAAPVSRWLEVSEGEVWLTGGHPGQQAVDVWLQSGQNHPLPACTAWVMQGWPQARVTVLETPARMPVPDRFSVRWAAWLRAALSSASPREAC
jgi:hypothetical protein